MKKIKILKVQEIVNIGIKDNKNKLFSNTKSLTTTQQPILYANPVLAFHNAPRNALSEPSRK